MGITYKNSITAEEVNFLRASVGFRQIAPEQIAAGLEGSRFISAACSNGQIVGMARLIWDGGGAAILKDVIVLPEYRERGLEEELVGQVLEYLREKLKPGFGIQVDVQAWKWQDAIYRNLGFEISTPERRGIPMQICLTDHIELTDKQFRQCGFSESQ